MVKNLPLTEDHYLIAYDTLMGRYQNKRKSLLLEFHS